MEIFFLIVLILIMVAALGSGFPVAFTLPGSAILTIGLAALAGLVFAGDSAAYFAHGDPLQWLSAGVTNLRGIYWEAERDTLIAIPLFIFMGIMLERSKIAEDLLVTMGQLFGPIPGGLGISVVFVGALLAATTGIVGATVIAMGLISLPVMLRANYSHSLATGTISASGTLGQIIPPSIVLIILADQLSNATDQGSAIRTADYKLGTGSAQLPSEFDLTSTSAGDMFVGAFLPGLVLVGLYTVYILILALIRPNAAPPAPFQGKYDRQFLFRVLIVLIPPLTLIFVVLGAIILGVATVNQAGAVGAVGAMIMAGYRLMHGAKGAYYPAILAIVSLAAIVFLIGSFDLNVKNITNEDDALGVALAVLVSAFFLISVFWSGWRAYKLDNTLVGVMVETAKTTSLVFIILLGAAMLTSAFRAFGGEDLVRDFLTGLPGGFTGKFIVVMAVIFILGFFLDFIEIAVVVVPIIAPILLADPTANVTAVWLGVMIGVNMQTSFLTPPFGFALFYLRGVAPAKVRTIEMYRGVVPFILLQLTGLAIVGLFPALVNYLPNKVYLTSETAPPPKNPRLQACIEEHLFAYYDENAGVLRSAVDKAKTLGIDYLPDNLRGSLRESFSTIDRTFDRVADVRAAAAAVAAFVPDYEPLHSEARDLRILIGSIERKLKNLAKDLKELTLDHGGDGEEADALRVRIAELGRERDALKQSFPGGWEDVRKRYVELETAEKKARRLYRRTVDDAYEPIVILRATIASAAALAATEQPVRDLASTIESDPADRAMDKIKDVEALFGEIDGAGAIKSKLSRARRALKGDEPDREKAKENHQAALDALAVDLAWRQRAASELLPDLVAYDESIKGSIGLRQQERLSEEQAGEVASCMAVHRNISFSF